MTVFRSKVDSWLVLVVAASAVAALVGAATALRSDGGWLAAALIALVGVALPLWIVAATTYTVTPGRLLVRCGPFRWRIAVDSITAIEPTRSAASGPALSLARLRIRHAGGRRSVLVSPARPEDFIRALRAARTAA